MAFCSYKGKSIYHMRYRNLHKSICNKENDPHYIVEDIEQVTCNDCRRQYLVKYVW